LEFISLDFLLYLPVYVFTLKLLARVLLFVAFFANAIYKYFFPLSLFDELPDTVKEQIIEQGFPITGL